MHWLEHAFYYHYYYYCYYYHYYYYYYYYYYYVALQRLIWTSVSLMTDAHCVLSDALVLHIFTPIFIKSD